MHIVGRVYIKGINIPMKNREVYTAAIQSICAYTHALLCEKDQTGMVVADSRTKSQNAVVAHSIFTEKFRRAGDKYGRILEMPVFGHSENHAGLQIADLVVSALVAPMACYAYCRGHINSPHVDTKYGVLKQRFGRRLERLQFRYAGPDGRMRGGLTVCDSLTQRSGGALFH